MASTAVVRCKEACRRGTSSAAGAAEALSLSGGSHAIANTTPTPQRQQKIRIVHIFAPEIIKTEAHNFRALVQRLTGKPRQAGRRSHLRLLRRITDKNAKKQHQLEEATTGRSPQHVEPKRDPENRAENRSPSTEDIKVEPWMEEDEAAAAAAAAGEEGVMTMMRMSSSSSNSSSSTSSSSGGFLDGLGDLELGFFHGYGDLQWPQLLIPMASSSSSSSHVDV